MSNSNLYEVCFLCISKKECEGEIKDKYKKNLEEIFQNERIEYNFEIKTFIVKDPTFNSIKSTIQLYRKLSKDEVNPPKSEGNHPNDEKSEKNNKEKNELNKKIYFCALNKEKLYSNISFCDSIGKFFDKSLYFVKYISNKNMQSSIGETKIIEIARCGYNMEKILKEMGYEESKTRKDLGFYYQYKYYPIICIYGIMTDIKNIFLQVRGYYTDNNKDEILDKLNKVAKQLSDLFYIKSFN